MRPKKLVVLVDAEESQLSVRAFLLRNKGYRVMACGTLDVAMEIVAEAGCAFERERGVEVMVLRLSGDGADQVASVRRVRERWPELPIVLMRPEPGSADLLANLVLAAKHCSAGELVEAVRLCASRKRGPKKRPVAGSVAMQEAA